MYTPEQRIIEFVAEAHTYKHDARIIDLEKCETCAPVLAFVASRAKLLEALKAIEGVIDDAIDTRIRSGRLPPIGGLLSTIQDEARVGITEAKGE